jgi:hypothetical protein
MNYVTPSTEAGWKALARKLGYGTNVAALKKDSQETDAILSEIETEERLLSQISAIEEEAKDKVGALALEFRSKVLIPFCRRYNLTFKAGMGGYVFIDSKGEPDYGEEEHPWIKAMSEMLDNSAMNNSFGSWFEDITIEDLGVVDSTCQLPVRSVEENE